MSRLLVIQQKNGGQYIKHLIDEATRKPQPSEHTTVTEFGVQRFAAAALPRQRIPKTPHQALAL
jgi:hypothetical protein